MIGMTIVTVMPQFEASLLELPITLLQPSFTLPEALFMMLIVQVYDHHLPSLFMNIYNKDYSSIIDIYYYNTFSTLTQTFRARAQLFRHPV